MKHSRRQSATVSFAHSDSEETSEKTNVQVQKRLALGLSERRPTAKPTTQRPPQQESLDRIRLWMLVGVLVVLIGAPLPFVFAKEKVNSRLWAGAPGLTGQLELTLVNASDIELCYVHISLTSDMNWGTDLLGSEETIPPDEVRSLRIAPGAYDMRALDCHKGTVGEVRAVSFRQDGEWLIATDDSAANLEQDAVP